MWIEVFYGPKEEAPSKSIENTASLPSLNKNRETPSQRKLQELLKWVSDWVINTRSDIFESENSENFDLLKENFEKSYKTAEISWIIKQHIESTWNIFPDGSLVTIWANNKWEKAFIVRSPNKEILFYVQYVKREI